MILLEVTLPSLVHLNTMEQINSIYCVYIHIYSVKVEGPLHKYQHTTTILQKLEVVVVADDNIPLCYYLISYLLFAEN